MGLIIKQLRKLLKKVLEGLSGAQVQAEAFYNGISGDRWIEHHIQSIRIKDGFALRFTALKCYRKHLAQKRCR